MAILPGLALSLHIYIYSVCRIARKMRKHIEAPFNTVTEMLNWNLLCGHFEMLPISPSTKPKSVVFSILLSRIQFISCKNKRVKQVWDTKISFHRWKWLRGCCMSAEWHGALLASDPPVDKQPDGSQRCFAGRHSLFCSFAWVELDLARRSSLEAGIKTIRRDLECVRLKAGLQSHPSPPPLVGTSHLHITRLALFSFAFVSPSKLWQPSKDDIS